MRRKAFKLVLIRGNFNISSMMRIYDKHVIVSSHLSYNPHVSCGVQITYYLCID